MASAFLLGVFWKKATPRAVNLLLTAGTIFSLGTGILYYTGMILTNVHFLLISFLIFIILTAVTMLISLADRPSEKMAIRETTIRHKPDGKTVILWGILIAVMIAVYIIFNGH
jgi:SSS family solute:Na+ symporter